MSMAGSSPQTPAGGDDWTAQVAGTIESVVTGVRDKTTAPLVTVARGLVYGMVAGVFGIAIMILMTITAVRLLDIIMPIWLTYLVLGGIFLLGGLVLWLKAWTKPRS